MELHSGTLVYIECKAVDVLIVNNITLNFYLFVNSKGSHLKCCDVLIVGLDGCAEWWRETAYGCEYDSRL